MAEIPQFGERAQGVQYIERPGAYVTLVDLRGEIAIIDVDGRVHLPGGGIEPGESAVEAARREVLEEVGIEAPPRAANRPGQSVRLSAMTRGRDDPA